MHGIARGLQPRGCGAGVAQAPPCPAVRVAFGLQRLQRPFAARLGLPASLAPPREVGEQRLPAVAQPVEFLPQPCVVRRQPDAAHQQRG